VRKLLEIGSGRHPFQVLTAVACPLVAAAVLISGQAPRSLDEALPGNLKDIWLIGLAVAGIVTNFGAYWRWELDTGLIVEGGGIALLGSMLTIYVAALFLVSGAAAAAAGGFILMLALGAWWRAGQIVRDVRKVWRAQREGLTAQVRLMADPDAPPGGDR
jgi:hypothetical protein